MSDYTHIINCPTCETVLRCPSLAAWADERVICPRCGLVVTQEVAQFRTTLREGPRPHGALDSTPAGENKELVKTLGHFAPATGALFDGIKLTNTQLVGKKLELLQYVQMQADDDKHYYVVQAKNKSLAFTAMLEDEAGVPSTEVEILHDSLVVFGTGKVQTQQLEEYIKKKLTFPVQTIIQKPQGKRFFVFG